MPFAELALAAEALRRRADESGAGGRTIAISAMTAILEDATEAVISGQSAQLTPSQLADHGCRLQAAARDIGIIAEAAAIVANLGVNHPPNRRKPRR